VTVLNRRELLKTVAAAAAVPMVAKRFLGLPASSPSSIPGSAPRVSKNHKHFIVATILSPTERESLGQFQFLAAFL
jgi:hypothetical protein